MKDYLLNCDDSRRNILSYKIKNGEIVAKLASGELYIIPYSDENENTIISKMEEQVRKAQIMPIKKAEKKFSIMKTILKVIKNKDDKPLVIRDLTQYRQELKKGSANFDFSQLDVSGEDIQFINLENLNLDINLREVFVPFGGRAKWGNNFLEPLFSFSHFGGDDFLNIKDSKLSGNNITGDLTPFKDNSYYKPVYFYYSEETFDDNYKLKYPQFFISKDAPLDLREKYYNPKECILEIEHRKYNAFVRQTLTFDEYLKYYKYLKGKYLGNFSISKHDLKQIKIIEKYGLEKGKVIFKEGDAVLEHINGINQTGKFEACDKKIDKNDDSSVLSLKLRRNDYKKGANT